MRYTAEHEWVKPAADGTVRVGLTDFAQRQLGDTFTASQPFGSVESVKTVTEVYAPVSGTVVARNERLRDERNSSTTTRTAKAG